MLDYGGTVKGSGPDTVKLVRVAGAGGGNTVGLGLCVDRILLACGLCLIW